MAKTQGTVRAWMRTHCLAYTYASASYACRPSLVGAYALIFRCVRMNDRIGFQDFVHDPFVPCALFSYFRSDSSVFKPKKLEQPDQDIERNRKRDFKFQLLPGQGTTELKLGGDWQSFCKVYNLKPGTHITMTIKSIEERTLKLN
ncbi:hypothetical protein PIB30_086582 [Stylosanthes scabra]|uniref:TF-B3 domain-containing protein n=1 Tax=Stylosanthes scabra TaxID=79078 RepID=A0ABU6TSN1_9FABA|nr:hypothetical protein [Stylosanthes scabra]